MSLVVFFLIFAVALFAIGFGTGYGMRSMLSEWRRHAFDQRQRQ